MFLKESKQKRERVIALDLLRGTFLLVIFVNHIAWSPTFFDVITGRSHLFASAAEGFFVISGMLVGYIYGPRILTKTTQTIKHLWKRAGWLYLLAIGFTCLYAFMATILPQDSFRNQPMIPEFGEFVWRTLTLQFGYGWADFLSRYAVLMALAPAVLFLVAKKLWWLVGIISIVIWATLGQTFASTITAWQLVFTGGIIIGYYLPRIEATIREIPKKPRAILANTLFTAAAITFAISTVLTIVFPTLAGSYQHLFSPNFTAFILQAIDFRFALDQSLFHRETLAVGRILIGILWFTALFILYRKYEKQIDKATKGTLLLLGTNSLFVYGLQSFILFLMDAFFDPSGESNIFLNTLITTTAIYIVYLATKHRVPLRNFRKSIIRV